MSVAEVDPGTWGDRVLAADGLVLVDVWAPWCIPCRRVEPLVAALAERFAGAPLTCLRLNADEAPDLIARHAVLSLPTVLLFRSGQEVGRTTGVPKRGRLDALVEDLLARE